MALNRFKRGRISQITPTSCFGAAVFDRLCWQLVFGTFLAELPVVVSDHLGTLPKVSFKWLFIVCSTHGNKPITFTNGSTSDQSGIYNVYSTSAINQARDGLQLELKQVSRQNNSPIDFLKINLLIYFLQRLNWQLL